MLTRLVCDYLLWLVPEGDRLQQSVDNRLWAQLSKESVPDVPTTATHVLLCIVNEELL